MKGTLAVGLSRTRRITVDEGRTIGFMGEGLRVYATPELVRDIEVTSRELLLEHCDPGEDSVGIRVAIDHLAATPLGHWVDITVSVSAVDGRRVGLTVVAEDAVEPVASGEHGRFVVDVARTGERLKAKAAKLAEG